MDLETKQKSTKPLLTRANVILIDSEMMPIVMIVYSEQILSKGFRILEQHKQVRLADEWVLGIFLSHFPQYGDCRNYHHA